jgi:hypothetical protein
MEFIAVLNEWLRVSRDQDRLERFQGCGSPSFITSFCSSPSWKGKLPDAFLFAASLSGVRPFIATVTFLDELRENVYP